MYKFSSSVSINMTLAEDTLMQGTGVGNKTIFHTPKACVQEFAFCQNYSKEQKLELKSRKILVYKNVPAVIITSKAEQANRPLDLNKLFKSNF